MMYAVGFILGIAFYVCVMTIMGLKAENRMIKEENNRLKKEVMIWRNLD